MKRSILFWLFLLHSTVQWLNAQEFRDSIQGTYRYWDDVNQQIIGNYDYYLIKRGSTDSMDYIITSCGDPLLNEFDDKTTLKISVNILTGEKEGTGNLPFNCSGTLFKVKKFYFNSEYQGSVMLSMSNWIGPSPGWGNEYCIIRVSESVGREDELEQIKLSLSPNPVQTHLKLSLSNAVQAHIGIFDLHGRQLLEKQTQVAENELDVSELPAGMYWLRVQSPAGMVCKSFVKE